MRKPSARRRQASFGTSFQPVQSDPLGSYPPDTKPYLSSASTRLTRRVGGSPLLGTNRPRVAIERHEQLQLHRGITAALLSTASQLSEFFFVQLRLKGGQAISLLR